MKQFKGFGVRNEARQRLTGFVKRTHLSQETPSSSNTRDISTHGYQQMVNIEIRLIIFFAAKDGEAPQCQQKQDLKLTATQIMNSLENSELN